MLLERDGALAAIEGAAARVRTGGAGRFVVVGGEAGVGKTALLRAAAERAGDLPVHWGACDSLTTPRVLGPLVDVAAAVGGDLADALAAGAPREAVFAATLRALSAAPVVVVVEDAHWADEATVDLLTFLRRRIGTTAAVVAVTYRDDEIGPTHPLRFVLAGTPGPDEVRVRLDPLSPDAVATLAAGIDVDPADVHRRTGGNPFFVTELLAVGGGPTPATVRDAVLARAARLAPEARVVLDAVAVVPVRAETWLVERLLDGDAPVQALDGCTEHGVLRADGDGVAFRHELARVAVRDAVAPVRRRDLHARAVAALARPPTGKADHARVVHHAEEAGDGEAVLRHARAAAREADRVGAAREVAAHLGGAARYVGRLPVEEQLALWRDLAIARTAIGDLEAAVDAFDAGIAAAVATGDLRCEGELRCRRTSPLVGLGRTAEATATLDAALALLEPLGPSPELASALLARTGDLMLARRLDEAIGWGARTLAMQEEVGSERDVAHTLVQAGVAAFMAGDPAGLDQIVAGRALATRIGARPTVALGSSQLGSGGGEIRRYDVAVPALVEGTAFALEHDLMGSWAYSMAWLGRCHVELGAWDEAGEELGAVLASPWGTGIARTVAVTALGRLRARRGDPGVWALLDESLELARANGHLQRLWPTAVVRAEAAWLERRLGDELPVLEEAHALALDLGYGWAIGELGEWLLRAGASPAGLERAVGPHRAALAGDLDAAADAWAALGCRFEAALVLLGSDDPARVRRALDAFDELGSAPAARLAADRVRALGGRVPRGPNAATRGNAAGLTSRELDVLALLVEGLRNAEIAERLVISAKTVDHHVSAVLAKLGVGSRQAAVAAALRSGLLKDGEGSR